MEGRAMTERELLSQALRLYLADGLTIEKAAYLTNASAKQWREGKTSQDPVQFARHFISLRHAAGAGNTVAEESMKAQASHQRREPIALPPVRRD